MSLKIPNSFGGYTICEKLSGAINNPVHFVEKDSKQYIIKFSQDSSLLNEYALMKQLVHENILPVINCINENGLYGLLMPHARGGDLHVFLSSLTTFITEEIARVIIKQLLEAVAFIHENNIIHRDIKPENVYFMNKGKDMKICLADFGIACSENDVNFNIYCGSEPYMAPEVFQKRPYSCKADCWGVGIILYWLLYNRYPFYKYDNDGQVWWDQNRLIIAKCSFTGIKRSPEAQDLIKRLLCVHPKHRISAQEALHHKWFNTPIGIEISDCRTLTAIQKELDSAQKVLKDVDVSKKDKHKDDDDGKGKGKDDDDGKGKGKDDDDDDDDNDGFY